MIKLMLMLVAGAFLFVYGLLMASHRPFQQWLYRREKGRSADLNSKEFEQALFNFRITGGGVGLAGGLLLLSALSDMRLID
jgi:hypothetical protein